ncbi:esterase/lipase family protein [Rhodococcus aetherivorans]|uniref:esterase/lipase family protein n=1 Tax=Rhodococcus aetherivorans TaxID=191292 RepID=UPI001E5376BD|nr:alpha/beta fold hydrolase [Rhodococcus aetherivorans]
MLLPAPAGAAPVALPVPYDLPDPSIVELANPGGSAPGSNDWTCRPSKTRPEPVVLVHNSSGNRQIAWQTFAPLLANEGYCVFALTFGAPAAPWPVSAVGGLGPIARSAQELSDFVDHVLAETGAGKVDLLGHSQGTLVSAYWVRHVGGATKVDQVVGLAPLWQGADVFPTLDLPQEIAESGSARPAFEAACPACQEMRPGSSFLRTFNEDGPFAEGVRYTNVLTTHDDVVVPYTNGRAEGPNVTNIVLQDICRPALTSHLEMLADRLTASLVLAELDATRSPPTGCQ